MTLKGTRGAENALEFYTGNHIWMFAVEIGIDHRWIERISSGGKNHRTNVQSDLLFLHAVLYSFGLAGGHAGETLTAGHAVEAFGCLGPGLLFAKSQLHLSKTARSFCHTNVGLFGPGNFLKVFRNGDKILLGKLHRLSSGPHILTPQITRNGNGSFSAVSHCPNGHPGTSMSITTGKYTLCIGGEGHRVSLDGPPAAYLQPCGVSQKG